MGYGGKRTLEVELREGERVSFKVSFKVSMQRLCSVYAASMQKIGGFRWL